MSLDPRFHPTPVEPKWTVDSIRGEFYDEHENSIFILIDFEYHLDREGYHVNVLRGHSFDPEQCQEIILDYLKVYKAQFNFA